MAGKDTVTFTDDNFDAEVLKSDKPVLVDFWAEWCPPCKALGPTIDELATELAGKVKVGKLDIENNEATAVKFGISSIPALMVFKGGRMVKQTMGLQSKSRLLALINDA